jgi:hypothetical protein
VDETNVTPAENTEPEDSGGEEQNGDTNPDGSISPIVIDMGKDGFRFSSLDEGVRFDLDADGSLDTVAWVAMGSNEVFLALDRNLNGIIDDGSELFGNYTEQPASDDPNGYRALEVFDSPLYGGDEDGRITSRDAVYQSLIV